MPAIDNCEPAVIKALEKAGWHVTDQPYIITLGEKYLFADLRLRDKDNQEIMIVEVKCFPESKSDLDSLYGAIGQYLLYRSALSENGISDIIYLSIPLRIYDTLIQEDAVRSLIAQSSINCIVVDIEREEIVKWQI